MTEWPAGRATRPLSRRAFLCAVPSAGLAFSGDSVARYRMTRQQLHSSTVAIGDDQQRILVPPDQQLAVPGSRVLAEAGQRTALLAQEAAWQRSTRIPGTPGSADFQAARLALLDLRVLMLDAEAPVAGWSPHWRYVWPRDSAFVVAALATVGQAEDAAGILAFLQRVQAADGTFEARYIPGTDRPPDRRHTQLDGTGWSLWGLLTWAQALPEGTRAERLRRFTGLLNRSAGACLRLTAGGRALPPASPDYWELPTRQVTLGNAALFLVGLQAATRLYGLLGDPARAAVNAAAARRYRDVLAKTFSPNGYPRLARSRQRDAAVCFLLPPFVDEVDAEVLDAWQQARTQLRRPAGGLAPGADWKQDGISWTPETALFAMTAAGVGDHGQARHWLDWLLAHRTIAGSFPEKVNADGTPAAVAPLAWTTAAVVLALAAVGS